MLRECQLGNLLSHFGVSPFVAIVPPVSLCFQPEAERNAQSKEPEDVAEFSCWCLRV